MGLYPFESLNFFDPLLFSVRSGQCHQTLRSHQGNVTCVQLDELKIVSGSTDKTLKVWDLRTGECMNTISVGSPVTSLMFDEKRLIVAAEKTAMVCDCVAGIH